MSARRDALGVGAFALAARLAVVAWAWSRIPPAADGTLYQTIAERIGRGLGYTWLWPDGAVTYAAHYPVGYPALVGALYAIVGPSPGVAMLFNALVGALGAVAVHRLAARVGRREGLVAGALVALHPGLVMYTPALMTEGVTASLVAIASLVAAWARDRREALGARGPLAIGAIVGVATLVRPQSLVLAPVLAWIAVANAEPDAALVARARRVVTAAAIALGVALAVCAPWTARNCARMHRCALVSVNGGWNLLIGADLATEGGWSPIQVPDACKEVYDEAGKDACFGAEARRAIEAHPLAWLALAPKKIAATFDYVGAAPWYLHAANADAFGDRAKLVLGAIETVFERLARVAALVWASRSEGARPRARLVLGVASAAFALSLHAWIAYLGLVVVACLRGRALVRGPVLGLAALVVLVATAATHAVFFGGGRYALVALPLVTGLAGLARLRPVEG